MSDSHECQEAYNDCLAARKARVEAAIKNAEPWETAEQIAKKAAVDRATITRAKTALLQTGAVAPVCNSAPSVPTQASVKLRDLYERDKSTLVGLGFRKNVSAAESALDRCSRLEQAYFISEIVPVFKKDLESWLNRRKRDGIVRYKYVDGNRINDAEEDYTTHEASGH